MSRYGVISDVHGNLDALCAAVAFLRERGVERVLCLGDIVGYNPAGNECVAAVRTLGATAVAGNHDLIALGRLGFERCSDKPAFTLRRTRRDLSDESRAYLGALPLCHAEGDLVLVHGGFDDVTQYVTSPARVAENHARMAALHPGARVCLFGHTHAQKLYEVHRGAVQERAAEPRVELGGGARTYFVNPGSIDASRKSGERVAEFAEVDPDRGVVWFHSVPYDHERVEAAARARGYRMTRLDELVYRGARLLRRGRSFAARRLARALGRGGAPC